MSASSRRYSPTITRTVRRRRPSRGSSTGTTSAREPSGLRSGTTSDGGLAAEAAARQGAFCSIHEQLFAHQDQLEDGHLRTHAAANSPLMLFCGPSATRPRWGARPTRRTQTSGRPTMGTPGCALPNEPGEGGRAEIPWSRRPLAVSRVGPNGVPAQTATTGSTAIAS